MCDKSNKISTEKMYEKLWSCRDLEIEHYWHRMVFMTAFLVLSFAAYGGLVVALIGAKNTPPFMVTNAGCFLLAVVGIVVSIFWIMMSKGSKAWQEEYEYVITAYIKNVMVDAKDIASAFAGHDYIALEKDGLEPAKINDFIWSTKAGGYSVSKVGIAVGHLAMLVWGIIAGVHLYLITYFNDWATAASSIERKITGNNLFYGAVIFLLLFWLYAKSCLFSGYFEKRNKER